MQVLKHAGVERLSRKVKLRAPPSESKFWRYHSAGDGHLSTIEGRIMRFGFMSMTLDEWLFVILSVND